MISQSGKLTRVIRPKRQLFSKSSIKTQNCFQRDSPSIQFFAQMSSQGRGKSCQMLNFQQDTAVSLIEENQSTDNTIQKCSTFSDNDSNSSSPIIQCRQQQLTQKIAVIQFENKLIQRLKKLNYSERNGYQLEEVFKEKICKHIFFKGFRPYAQTLIGANLITNGIFHELWSHVLKKQQYLSFQCLRNKYYEDFKYCIKSNFNHFESAFSQQPFLLPKFYQQEENSLNNSEEMNVGKQQSNADQQNKMDQEFRQLPKEQMKGISEKVDEQRENNQEQNEIDLLFEQLSGSQSSQLKQQENKQNQEQEYPSPRKQIPAQLPVDEQQQYCPTNLKLLKHRQINQRRISAEMVCHFFDIHASHTFSLDDIRIQQVLQMHKNSRFQYAIVMGRNARKQYGLPYVNAMGDEGQNNNIFEQPCKLFISCYKFLNIQQLIRLELTYGRAFGFIAYDSNVDFYGYLKTIIEKGFLSQSRSTSADRIQHNASNIHGNYMKQRKQYQANDQQMNNRKNRGHSESESEAESGNLNGDIGSNVLIERYWKQKLQKKYNLNRASSGGKRCPPF